MSKSFDTLRDEYGAKLCEELGFLPTSNSTKPLYIANGLFRESTGQTCELRDVHKWVVSERRAKAVPSRDLLEEFSSILSDSSRDLVDELQEVRFYLERIFNPDSTVYPSYDNSVMNISSKWLVRPYTKAEAGIGHFLFEILNESIDGAKSPALEQLRLALQQDDDDITRLIKPIIVREPEAERLKKLQLEPTSTNLNQSKLAIRRGFDRLAKNIELLGEAEDSLLVLRRLICFSSFAVFFYLADVNHSEFFAPQIPLLLDAGLGLGAIASASSSSFLSCKKVVETYTINILERYLSSLEGQYILDIRDQESIAEYIGNIKLYHKKNDVEEIRSIILQHFKSYCEKGETPIRAISRALQFALYTYTYPNNTPSDFCSVIGKRGGLVGPAGSSAKQVRLLVHRFALENLVLSAVEPDQLQSGLELRELGVSLRDSYSVIIGTDTDGDYSMLANARIAQDTPENLRSELSLNAQGIADMLISLGLAKRYADGVTIIGTEV
ncbi:hypothetical protein LJC63_10465 [Ruminococcaceae bacterium OttesenSCG-928-L11]|nr:hypothetical protein [Ruminococcaceae bacterium OttesenSCG-928-L11]